MFAEFISPEDKRWMVFLKKVPHDFYHLPEFMSFSSVFEGGIPVAFFAENSEAALFIPLLIRTLPVELDSGMQNGDALSPYGYPGPIFYGNPAYLQPMLEKFSSLGRDLGIVSVFCRIHPLIHFPLDALKTFGSLVKHGPTVFIDLSCSPEEMWRQTSQNHKRSIKKLQKNGFLTVRNNWQHYNQFISIYRSTMLRVKAQDYYYFSDDYFHSLRDLLDEKLALWTVLSSEGEVAAGALFTFTDGIIEYHLGGTLEKFLPISPIKLLFFDVPRWAKNTGCRLLSLGGGLGGKMDSLYEFKAGFSDNHADFFTFRMILDQEKYDVLVNKRRFLIKELKHDEEFFPLYRKDMKIHPTSRLKETVRNSPVEFDNEGLVEFDIPNSHDKNCSKTCNPM